MKLCIVTITNGSNYGNRLQNYALQEILQEKFDYTVATLRNLNGEVGTKIIKNKLICKALKNKKLNRGLCFIIRKPRICKKLKFIQFNERYINWVEPYITSEDVPKSITNEYDCFIAGSDQIWNTSYPIISSIEFLKFAPENKRIAYAASFGPGKFTDYERKVLEKHIDCLKSYVGISVREESSMEVLKEYNIDNTCILPDPTLLLDSKKWEEIEEKPLMKISKKGYMLVYCLPDFSESDEIVTYNEKRLKFIDKMAEKYGYQIIDICNSKDYKTYAINPSEFIYLIHHAQYVCTNSFHATVFSIIFHKKFSTYTRDNSNARIKHLLDMLGIYKCYENEEMDCIDYEIIDENIKAEKNRGLDFLEKNIEKVIG